MTTAELLQKAGIREVSEPSLVGWEPLVRAVAPDSDKEVLEMVQDYKELRDGGKTVSLVRMQDGKITIWERTDRADIWKQD